jgi:hypothetical protein
MSDENLEPRINIKFCVKIGKSACETLSLLTVAYGEYARKKSSVSEWNRLFKEGRDDVQDDPRSGQPKTQRTDASVGRASTLVRSDRRSGLRLIAEELNMNRKTVRQIITEDLEMRKFSAKNAQFHDFWCSTDRDCSYPYHLPDLNPLALFL